MYVYKTHVVFVVAAEAEDTKGPMVTSKAPGDFLFIIVRLVLLSYN